jgi:aspartate racemase
MKVIGILGGSSDQATAEYYRLLNQAVQKHLGGWNTAELVLNSMNFAVAEAWVRNGRWEEAGADLAARAASLERAGADLLICVSNTLHKVAEVFTAGLRIPFLHIVDPTAEAIRKAGLRRVGLLGTRPAMAADSHLGRRYAERFGIEIVVPDAAAQETVDRIIFDELCRGVFLPESRATYLEIIERVRARGAEGIILGCTEIPLLVTQADRPDLPMFDTAALHAEAAVALALEGDRGAPPQRTAPLHEPSGS